MNVPRPSLDILGSPRILFAAAPLIVPMTLRLSSLSLRAIVVLVVSRQKGITLVFKNDPLESVNVSSSFDGVESVAGYIQREIEGQLREAFRSDLPGVIHRLSQKWLSGEVKSATEGANGPGARKHGKGKTSFDKDARIETRTAYTSGKGGKGRGIRTNMDAQSVGDESISINSEGGTAYTSDSSPRRREYLRRVSPAAAPDVRQDALLSVPEAIEAYDPTYGLRPDSMPLHAGFAEYERLVRSTTEGRGLGDVLESSDSDEEGIYDGPGPDDSFEMIGLHDITEKRRMVGSYRRDSAPDLPRTPHRSRYNFDSNFSPSASVSGYETIPAVGGGTITRPRIFHTQSQMRTRAASSGSLSAHGSPSTATARAKDDASTSSTLAAIARRSSYGFAPLDGRAEYFAGLGGVSGSSTPRMSHSFSAGAGGGGSFISSPSMMRNGSLPLDNLRPKGRIRSSGLGLGLGLSSKLSSNNSISPETSTRFSSHLATSGYSSPDSSVPSPPSDGTPFPRPRPAPVDLLDRSPSSILDASFSDEDLGLPITLNAARSDACAHLATLTNSNQTLSPFTRGYEHVTNRSCPHVVVVGVGSRGGIGLTGRGNGGSGYRMNGVTGNLVGGNGEAVKAQRKRIHRIGAAKLPLVHEGGSRANGGSEMGGSSNGRRSSKMLSPSSLMMAGGGGGLKGGGKSTRAPSEMSDYFPVFTPARVRGLGALGKRVGGTAY